MDGIRIGIDARPLTVPVFGIGRYLQRNLEYLTRDHPEVNWILYADRPLPEMSHLGEVVRCDYPAHSRWRSLLRSQLGFAYRAARDQLDVFWSPRHHLPLMLPARIRTLLTIHDLVWQKYPQAMQPANRWLERLLMPPSLQRADRILAVSEATRRDLIAAYPAVANRTIVTPLAADGLNTTKETPPADPYLLFVGTLEPRKNLDGVLTAFAAIESQIGACRLVIAGAQGWMPEISTRIHALGLSRVDVLGHVTDDKLASLYTNALAFVFPSFYEGFGLPLLEAMQAGTPVIAGNTSAMPEVVADGGILVAPQSSTAIAEAMLFLVKNQRDRIAIGERARHRAAEFSWAATADATWEALVGLMAGKTQV